MKNRELQDAVQALGKLVTIPMPVASGLKIRKFIRTLNQLSEDVEAERIKLINELSDKDSEGKPLVVEIGNGLSEYGFTQNRGEFDTRFRELMDCEVGELPPPLKASQLGDVKIEPLILFQLGDLIEE